jgi:uncharacterized protein (DUF4415 family)
MRDASIGAWGSGRWSAAHQAYTGQSPKRRGGFLAISRLDPHPDGDPWQTVGVAGTVFLFVVHTYPESNPVTGAETGRIISARKAPRMKRGPMRKASSDLIPEQATELQALAALPDDRIDTRDIPEQKDWRGAKRGLFFRPIRKQLTLRLDADLIAWFKSRAPNGEGYSKDGKIGWPIWAMSGS